MKEEKKATRQSYGETLEKLGEKYSDIVVLDADLATATKTINFAKKFPERFFDMGIAEANMMSTSAGMATTGKVPFAPVYVRLSRLATPIIYDENQNFEFGKMIQIGNGIDATIFASGDVPAEALKAKEILAKTKGIDIRVVDVHTIKPIDEDMIVKCAKETKRLISIEDHNVIGGLGSAISEVLTSKYPAKLERIGINDEFGRSGKAEELVEFYGLSAEKIVEKFL